MKMDKKVKCSIAAVTIAFLVFVAYAAYIIGTVRMPWEVLPRPTASMTPSEVTLPICTVYYDEAKTVDPADVADLTVENGAVDITISLGGDYGGFNALSIVIQLKQGGEVKYQAILEPTIIVSNVLNFGPTGWGGWSDKTASAKGQVATCFVRNVGSGEGDLAQLVRWVPGASVTAGGSTYTYPNTPFGYTYTPPETGYIAQNDNDHDSLQLVLVYPPTSVTISGVAPGTYDVYIGFTVTAGNVPCSGEATLSISY